MIANISPALGCSEHTLNTLRYADRVKELRAKPDIKIGQGNTNLNFTQNQKPGCPEDLSLQMMMEVLELILVVGRFLIDLFEGIN